MLNDAASAGMKKPAIRSAFSLSKGLLANNISFLVEHIEPIDRLPSRGAGQTRG